MSVNHGANLYELSAKYGFSKEDFMDFSSNINPFGSSKKAKQYVIDNIDMVSMYPDPEYVELKKSISIYCKCNSENIVLGSGATELISSFIGTVNPKKAVLVSPAYSEYEKELNKIGCEIKKYYSKKENHFEIDPKDLANTVKEGGYELLIICNPCNPTGFAFSKDQIREIVSTCGCYVMIDETYVEFVEDMDKITAMPLTESFDNLIVLRGVSKFFAAPGLRFGYGVTGNNGLLSQLNSIKNPWSLNSIGAYAGELLLSDKNYIQKSRSLISSERKRICKRLRAFSFIQVYEPAANFILLKICKDNLTSYDVFVHAIQRGLMIRDCSSFVGLEGEFIRFCLMNPEDNDRLLDCLEEILA